jgi:hypothetical protein
VTIDIAFQIQSLIPKVLNNLMEDLSSPDVSPELKLDSVQWICGVIGYRPPDDLIAFDNATLLDLERRVADWIREHQRRLLKGQ